LYGLILGANIDLSDKPREAKSSLTKDDMTVGDFVATVVELKGDCEPFQFTLDPPAVFLPGATAMHTTQRKAFRLINMSICPINFNWKQVLEPFSRIYIGIFRIHESDYQLNPIPLGTIGNTIFLQASFKWSECNFV